MPDHPIPTLQLFEDLDDVPPGSRDITGPNHCPLSHLAAYLLLCHNHPGRPALNRWGTEGLGLNFPSIRAFIKGEFFERVKTKRCILIREDVQGGQTEPCWAPALHFVRTNAFNAAPLPW